jgi:hypothetical protein
MQLEIYKNIDISHLINCLKLLILKLLNILNISINNTFIFNYNLDIIFNLELLKIREN